MEVTMGNGAGYQYRPGGEAHSYVQWVMIALRSLINERFHMIKLRHESLGA